MNFQQILLKILISFLLFSVWSCAQKERTWVDVAAISEQIERGEAPSTSLDSGLIKEDVGEETARDRDFTTDKGGDNPYLKGFEKVEKHETKAPSGDGILLNFDNADIYEVIQVIAETLDLNYIIDPQVKGVVNIRSGQKIPIEQLFIVFKKILNINGLDIRDEGDYYFIYVAQASSPLSINGPDQISSLTDSPRMVMQVIPVMHLASSEAIKLIEPYLSDKGISYNMTSQNMIILHDFESKIIDAITILARLDISPLATLKVKAIKINKAPMFDLRDELIEILFAMGINKKDFEGVSVIPLERVNSLLLISKNDYLLNSVEKWIKELDVVPSAGRDTLNIYNVRNSVASELAELVTSLISDDGSAKSTTKKTTSKDTKQTRTTTPKTSSKKVGGAPHPSLKFAGEPALFPDDTRNIILIRAVPADYSRIVKLLERLDNMPRQVLIEVLVAEVELTDTWQLGVEWSLKNNQLKINHASGQTTSYLQTFATSLGVGSDGFTYSVLREGSDVVGLLNAVASENEVSVLSSPQILVLNNEEATVNVGDQVPIITSETQNTADVTSVDKTVQYKDTGTILTVTPRINYNGMIILDVNQEVSLAKASTFGVTTSPVISTREIKTKLAVKDGQSILMGGLIKKNVDNTTSGVPLLKDIPLLGTLFRYQNESTTKTELLIMITPYVIESEDVLDQYIQKFNAKVASLRKEFSPIKKEKVKIPPQDSPKTPKEKDVDQL